MIADSQNLNGVSEIPEKNIRRDSAAFEAEVWIERAFEYGRKSEDCSSESAVYIQIS